MLKELEKPIPQLPGAAQGPHPDFPRPATSQAEPGQALEGKYVWLGLAALLVGLTVVNLLTLLRTPPPFVDEAWNANRAWGLLHTGHSFGTLDAGVFEKYPG